MTANFSSTWIAIIALLSGLALLIAGGECLISGAAKLAIRFGMSPLLIGLTVVGFGTSMPELFVSIKATIGGHPDIMFGNVVGSNIANIGLVLAISAMIYPLTVHFKRLQKEFVLLIGASLALGVAAVCGFFPRSLGAVFFASLIAYAGYSYHSENKQKVAATRPSDTLKHAQPSVAPTILLCVSGFVLMWFGSEYFIDGAVDLARFLGLSELVIGLTIAAVGTSLPELASCLSAVRKKEFDLLVGNILGSNLFNLLLVMGLTAVIKPFYFSQGALGRDLPVMIGFSVILVPICLFRKTISRVHGLGLFAAYCGYIVILGKG
jgi:cation:H+ antiporter